MSVVSSAGLGARHPLTRHGSPRHLSDDQVRAVAAAILAHLADKGMSATEANRVVRAMGTCRSLVAERMKAARSGRVRLSLEGDGR